MQPFPDSVTESRPPQGRIPDALNRERKKKRNISQNKDRKHNSGGQILNVHHSEFQEDDLEGGSTMVQNEKVLGVDLEVDGLTVHAYATLGVDQEARGGDCE